MPFTNTGWAGIGQEGDRAATGIRQAWVRADLAPGSV